MANDEAPAIDITEPEVPVQKNMALVLVNEKGYLQAKDLAGRQRIAANVFGSGMVPKSYKNAMQVLIGMEYALELGLAPLTGLRNVALINGQPSVWGELPLALVQRSGQLEMIEEMLFDKGYKPINFANKNLDQAWGAVCRTKRKGFAEIRETFFTLEMAKHAGLLSRDNVWKTYPNRMLQMRARSQNLKDYFADCLMGVSIAEYDFNHVPNPGEPRDVTRSGEAMRDGATELNGLFKDQGRSNESASVSDGGGQA